MLLWSLNQRHPKFNSNQHARKKKLKKKMDKIGEEKKNNKPSKTAKNTPNHPIFSPKLSLKTPKAPKNTIKTVIFPI
jgi:hypothetical protein